MSQVNPNHFSPRGGHSAARVGVASSMHADHAPVYVEHGTSGAARLCRRAIMNPAWVAAVRRFLDAALNIQQKVVLDGKAHLTAVGMADDIDARGWRLRQCW